MKVADAIATCLMLSNILCTSVAENVREENASKNIDHGEKSPSKNDTPYELLKTCKHFQPETLLSMKFLKHHPPLPVNLYIRVYIEHFVELHEVDKQLILNVHVESQWKDPRIEEFLKNSSETVCPGAFLQKSFAQFQGKIWIPALSFVSAHHVEEYAVPRSVDQIIVMPNGDMLHMTKYQMKLPCRIDLARFPMDKSFCYLIIDNPDYNSLEMPIFWHSQKPVFVPTPNFTTQHALTEFNQSRRGRTFNRPHLAPDADLWLTLSFVRKYSWYLTHAYVPSYLLILTSWLFNALGIESRVARLQLGSSLLLAILLIFSHIIREVPKVGLISALDVWLLLCLGFLILSTIQDTAVTILYHRYQRVTGKLDRRKSMQPIGEPLLPSTPHMNGAVNHHQDNHESGHAQQRKKVPKRQSTSFGTIFGRKARSISECDRKSGEFYRNCADLLDTWFIVIYPVAFLFANIVYWYWYLR